MLIARLEHRSPSERPRTLGSLVLSPRPTRATGMLLFAVLAFNGAGQRTGEARVEVAQGTPAWAVVQAAVAQLALAGVLP